MKAKNFLKKNPEKLVITLENGEVVDLTDCENGEEIYEILRVSGNSEQTVENRKHGKLDDDGKRKPSFEQPLEVIENTACGHEIIPSSAIEIKERDEVLYNAFETLSPLLRKIFFAHAEQKITFREIAKNLNMKEPTVKRKYYFACGQLKDKLKKLSFDKF